MNKPDIAKLVAAALEAEFGSYRNAELQHITAVNEGQHRELQALPVPTDDESREAYKDREFSWMRHLFGRRLDLDYSAGLLLGFSRVMTEHAIFVVANKSNLKLPLSLRTRPISDVLVKAFTDLRDAIANSDINKPHVTTYDVGELIGWAKEKGCVADEVLAEWEAYNNAKAVEAGQVTATATPDTVEPEPQTAQATPGEKSIPEWLSVTSDYIAGVMKEGTYRTCKELFNALEAKAGTDSPFEKGTMQNRGSLYVREIAATVSLKTMQNNWSEIRSLPR